MLLRSYVSVIDQANIDACFQLTVYVCICHHYVLTEILIPFQSQFKGRGQALLLLVSAVLQPYKLSKRNERNCCDNITQT